MKLFFKPDLHSKKNMLHPGIYKANLETSDKSDYMIEIFEDTTKVQMKSKFLRFNLRFIGKIENSSTLWYQQEIKLTSALNVLFCCPPIHNFFLNVYFFKDQGDNWYMKIIDNEEDPYSTTDPGQIYTLQKIENLK